MPNLEHTRKMPAEWPELLAFTDKKTHNFTHRPWFLASRQAFSQAEALSPLALESNYYYGLGKIMCGLARQLQDPLTREQLIQASVRGFVRHARRARRDMVPKDRPFVPVLGDLHDDDTLKALGTPFIKPTRRAWEALTPGERMLSNTLGAATKFRRKVVDKDWGPFKQAVGRSNYIAGARRLPYAAYAVSNEIFSGAASTLGWLLFDSSSPKPQATAPIDMKKVATFRKPFYFTPPARLRRDEFNTNYGWFDDGSSLWFNANVLQEPPQLELEGEKAPLRTERLGCEALYAGGLAVDVAVNILPEILVTASQIVPAELNSLRAKG